MTQNVVSLVLSDAQVAAATTGLKQIESALPGLISLPADDARGLVFMGERSGPFVRRTLRVVEEHPHVVPASLDIPAAQADLVAYDQLVPLLERLQYLTSRVQDTVNALGSDLMSTALDAYGHIKVSGNDHGLEDLRRQLGSRFRGTRTAATVAPTEMAGAG